MDRNVMDRRAATELVHILLQSAAISQQPSGTAEGGVRAQLLLSWFRSREPRMTFLGPRIAI